MDLTQLKTDLDRRGDIMEPLLPGANWIGLHGNFTPSELRTLADFVETEHKKITNVNKN